MIFPVSAVNLPYKKILRSLNVFLLLTSVVFQKTDLTASLFNLIAYSVYRVQICQIQAPKRNQLRNFQVFFTFEEINKKLRTIDLERGSLNITHKANGVDRFQTLKFCSLQRVTEVEVLITFRDMNKNHNVMDPNPIRPFRQVFGELSIYVVDIIDPSFLQELFPSKLKCTTENPVAKGKGMDTGQQQLQA